MNAMGQFLLGEIGAGRLCGASAGIWKDGKQVYREDFGFMDPAAEKPMPDNGIFRLYSSTKPITAVAAMILAERGILDLEDPVYKYLEGFRDQTVWSDGERVPVRRPVTVRDLLHMTSGLVYPSDDHPGREMGRLFDDDIRKAVAGNGLSTVDFCNEIGKVPLAFQPGEQWCYGTSADVLGAVIEVAANMPLSQFMAEAIFAPLQMEDTAFYVPAQKQDRLVTITEYDAGQKKLHPYTGNHLVILPGKEKPAFESGGAGLFSTMADYARFSTMLAGGGQWNGHRILKEETVEFMRTNQLTPGQLSSFRAEYGSTGFGYSCLMRNVLDPEQPESIGPRGAFGWDGWAGTCPVIDPKDRVVMQLFISRIGLDNRALHQTFCSLAYDCL